MSKSDNVTINIQYFLDVIKGINVTSVINSIYNYTSLNVVSNSYCNNKDKKLSSTMKSRLSLYLSSISVKQLTNSININTENLEKW